MKLAQIINCDSKFSRPYKLYNDDDIISEEYQLIAENVYQANYCYVICQDGEFEYDMQKGSGIIAIQENRPFIFVVKNNSLIDRIPFDSKITFEKNKIVVRGIFAIEKNSTATEEECKKDFETHLLNDLISTVGGQIQGLQSIKDRLDEKLKSIN